MNLSRITMNPDICHGKPTIRGMRIMVSNILEMLAGGMTVKEILADYPYLEKEDIQQSLQFAAKMSSFRQYPTEKESA